ncbi:MAG: hypothetical protein IJ461_11120 [Clostridia bacterium]|nr:hypothetical protein [Clostridia bacterium]
MRTARWLKNPDTKSARVHCLRALYIMAPTPVSFPLFLGPGLPQRQCCWRAYNHWR